MTQILDDGLIAELTKKYSDQDTTNFGVLDFISAFGSPLDALAYCRLFRPRFVELEGMVFRQECLEDDEDQKSVLGTLQRFGGDKVRTERSFNLVEVPSGLFSRQAGESSNEADQELARQLVELWSFSLARAFPDRSYIVETVTPEETGGEIGVVFYRDR